MNTRNCNVNIVNQVCKFEIQVELLVKKRIFNFHSAKVNYVRIPQRKIAQ